MLKKASAEAKLLLIGIPLAIWTLLPIYHLVLFALSPKEQAVSGKLWPEHPTLHNFSMVFHQEHHYQSGHILHHAAKGLMFPLPAPGSQPKRDPIKWDPAQPYRGLGFREVEAESREAKIAITEMPVVKG